MEPSTPARVEAGPDTGPALAGSGYEEFPCDLCEDRDAVEVPYSREYTNGQPVHICRGCGFVHVKMRRSAEAIAADWSEEIFGGSYTAAIPAVRARLTYVAELVANELGLRDKLVVDIGAGEGELLDIIRQDRYGARVFGIEPSEANCDLMRNAGIDSFAGTIEEFMERPDGAERKADIVTVTWTLENCQSCTGMLSAAHRILKDGGHIVVATGSRILVPFKKTLYDYFGSNAVDTHAFRFSANTLPGILAVSGFETTHVNRYHDSDILCVIAKKVDPDKRVPWEGDDYLQVHNFFERWHTDTQMYYSPNTRVRGL